MRAAFLRFAHKRYHSKLPALLTDVAAFTWATFFILMYGAALLAGWRPDAFETLSGIFLVGVPLAFGMLHRRIRKVASKAPDALYRKRVETTR